MGLRRRMCGCGRRSDAVSYEKIKANKYSRSIIENDEEAKDQPKRNKMQTDKHNKDMPLALARACGIVGANERRRRRRCEIASGMSNDSADYVDWQPNEA